MLMAGAWECTILPSLSRRAIIRSLRGFWQSNTRWYCIGSKVGIVALLSRFSSHDPNLWVVSGVVYGHRSVAVAEFAPDLTLVYTASVDW